MDTIERARRDRAVCSSCPDLVGVPIGKCERAGCRRPADWRVRVTDKALCQRDASRWVRRRQMVAASAVRVTGRLHAAEVLRHGMTDADLGQLVDELTGLTNGRTVALRAALLDELHGRALVEHDERGRFRRVADHAGYVLTERFDNSPRFDVSPDPACGEVAVDVRHVEVGGRAYAAGEFYRDADRFVR